MEGKLTTNLFSYTEKNKRTNMIQLTEVLSLNFSKCKYSKLLSVRGWPLSLTKLKLFSICVCNRCQAPCVVTTAKNSCVRDWGVRFEISAIQLIYNSQNCASSGLSEKILSFKFSSSFKFSTNIFILQSGFPKVSGSMLGFHHDESSLWEAASFSGQ